MSEALCQLCGEPLPKGEEMFNYHGYSGPCPKPPLPKPLFTNTLEVSEPNGPPIRCEEPDDEQFDESLSLAEVFALWIADCDCDCDRCVCLYSALNRILEEGKRTPEINLEQTRFNEILRAEHDLSDAYLRLRQILGAFDTPFSPTEMQVWEHTEKKAQQLRESRERMREALEKILVTLQSLDYQGGLGYAKHEAIREGIVEARRALEGE